MRPIVSVRNLSKLYRVGRMRNTSLTLREAFVDAISSPFQHLRQRKGGAVNPLWVLKNVSFEVAPGEVVGIIGRNGAGKSTLLKILARIVKPSAGEVDIYGRVGSLLEVGTGFHPDLTGRENIFLNGTILGMKRGMYLRLAFAIAAHLEPEILLLDEVLAVGDEAFQKKCLAKIKAISRDGRTIFFVSHNMTAIRRLCSRIFLIRSGELHEEDIAGAIVTKYLEDVDRTVLPVTVATR